MVETTGTRLRQALDHDLGGDGHHQVHGLSWYRPAGPQRCGTWLRTRACHVGRFMSTLTED
jgi:hypothetical protein